MDRAAMTNYIKKYGSLISFLAIEVLLFVALNLANYGVIYRYLGFFLALALLPFPLLVNKQNDWLDFIGLAAPLFVFGLFMVLSPLYRLLEDALGNISIVLGLISFLSMGYSLSKSPDFKIEKALLALFIGLAVLLGISFLITMYRYAPFYVLTYADKVIYYDGEVYYLAEEAKWLYAFSIKEVNLDHFGLYSVVTTSALGGLLFVPKKTKPQQYLPWLIAGALGVLTIAFLPNLGAIKYLLVPFALVAVIRFYPRKPLALKILKYVLYVFAGIASVAIILFIMKAFGGSAIQTFFAGNPILNRIFNNSRVYSYAYVLGHSFSYPFGGLYDIYNSSVSIVETTNSFVFDALYQGGFFAFFGILAFLFVAILSLVRYYKESSDRPMIKGLIISFIAAYFFYSAFNYQYVQMVHEHDLVYKSPFASDLLLLLSVFLIGYTFTPKKAKIIA